MTIICLFFCDLERNYEGISESSAMKRPALIVRSVLPLALIALAAVVIADVQDGSPFIGRNLAPLAIAAFLVIFSLTKNGGQWLKPDRRWPLASVGFAIPALGLSLYLHYRWATDFQGMRSQALEPWRLFRYLPAYTAGAGFIGFWIGWIVGRNVNAGT